MFYIFHGEDEFSRAEELTRLRAKLAEADPSMADLNTTFLDGDQLTLGQLRHACDAIPFMTDRRLVIVHGLLRRLTPSKGKDPAWKESFLGDLADYLPNLPPTTRLFLVEDEKLPASHPILKVAKAEEKKGFVKLFAQPKEWELPNWIRQRAQEMGGSINHEAVTLLAALVGNDLRLLDQEIEKLLLYADGRQVTTEDVKVLVSRAKETSIFDLVDCVGRRETDRALRLLSRMLADGAEPLYLLAMLARQIRILIQVSELRDQGLAQKEMARRLKLHPYVVKKGVIQSRNFEMAQLEVAHQRLVETDWAIKTGRMEDVLALDMLVVALTSI
ncbi:MAG: DNA polymerase III subunit delta [Anaerolineae bacterium]